jgi:hypothetical protein
MAPSEDTLELARAYFEKGREVMQKFEDES